MELAHTLKDPASGSDLQRLVDQLKDLKTYLATLKGKQALYITSKDCSQVFGVLLDDEAEKPRKRLQEQVEQKIIEISDAIKKKVAE